MASTSKGKVKSLGPRFYDYINGLREDFTVLHASSAKSTARPHRFNSYLYGLECEFELMAEDIESLRKERDEFQVKVEVQAMELQNARNDTVCERCNNLKGTVITSRNIPPSPLLISEASALALQSKTFQKRHPSSRVVKPSTLRSSTQRMSTQRMAVTRKSHSAITHPSPLKNSRNTPSLCSGPVVHSKSFQKSGTRSLVVNPSQPLRRLSQLMKVTRKSRSAITPSRPSQSISDSRRSDDTASHWNTPPLRQASTSIIDPDSGPEERDYSTTFNDGVGKELRMEMVHAFSYWETIWSVKFCQDGKFLAAGCADGKSYVYDVQTGTLIRVLRDLLAKKAFIRSVCFSRDGKYLATGSGYGTIYVWEIKTKYVRNVFRGHTGSVRSLDFSPNGRLLVSASQDNAVRVWNMRGGAAKVLTEDSPDLTPEYYSAVFSPDGGYIAASNHDGMVRVWRVRTGQLIRRVMAHMDVVFDLRFTPDGKGLVSASVDKTLKYWDFSSWNPHFVRARPQTSDSDGYISALEKQTRDYFGHDQSVNCLAISPDGRWLASGSYDETVRIWDTRSTAMQYSLNHQTVVYSVDFSPAGHYLASGDDGTVRIWRYSQVT